MLEVCRWLRKSTVSVDSKLMFLSMVESTPSKRLSSAVVKIAAIMKLRQVDNVVPDGLHPGEVQMLYEMELADIPEELLVIVHGVLAVKERWAFKKALSGFFTKSRTFDEANT